jgi:hypothetical protein
MRLLFVITLFLLILTSSISRAQECSPTFSEIYNLKIGTVIQYKTNSYNEWNASFETMKFTVIDYWIESDVITYIRKGFVYSNGRESDGIIYGDSSYELFDTIVIVNSPSRIENACDTQLVYYHGDYTYVIIDEYNDLKRKRISSDGYASYGESWIEGLGLSSAYEDIQMSYSIYKNIEGYIIDGDTTGIVWDDSEFTVPASAVYLAVFSITDSSGHSTDALISIDNKIISAHSYTPVYLKKGKYPYNVSAEGHKDKLGELIVDGTGVLRIEIQLEKLIDTDEDIIMYPNPATDIINIQFRDSYDKCEIQIVDLTGKVVLKQITYSINNAVINISELNRGIYFVKLVKYGNEKVIKCQKIVID